MNFANLTADIIAVNSAVEEWDAGLGPIVRWGGYDQKSLSEGLSQRFEQFCESLESDDFHEECWHIVLAADVFADWFGKWQHEVSSGTEMVGPSGTPDMWTAWQGLLGQLKKRSIRHVESIREFLRQGVGASQIAKNYNWRQPDGSLDMSRTHQAISDPDTVDPQLNPEDEKREEELAARWQSRVVSRQRKADDLAAVNAPAPESLEELLTLPGVTVAQIKKIKPELDDLTIIDGARRLGIRLSDQQFPTSERPASAVERLRKQEEEDDQAREVAEKMEAGQQVVSDEQRDVELRVKSLDKQGFSQEQIVELFSRQGTEITRTEVADILHPEEEPKPEPAKKAATKKAPKKKAAAKKKAAEAVK